MQKHHRALIDGMIADMAVADPDYAATTFWRSGVPPILADIEKHGIARFREHPSATVFYVPQYSRKIWRRHRAFLHWAFGMMNRIRKSERYGDGMRQIFDGTAASRADYRLLCALAQPGPFALTEYGESDVGGGERFEHAGRRFSRSWVNYMRGLAFVNLHATSASVDSILEIGGGYGTLGEILLKGREDGFYVNVDIPPVAGVSTYYLQQLFGEDAVLAYDRSRDMDTLDLSELRSRYRAVVICPWQLPRVTGSVDLFANFISFQEMEPSVVRNYASMVGPLTKSHVLLRNSVAGKPATHPGGLGVDAPLSTDDMVGMFEAFDLVGRDSFLYGDESPETGFRSEVLYLRRRRQEAAGQGNRARRD